MVFMPLISDLDRVSMPLKVKDAPQPTVRISRTTSTRSFNEITYMRVFLSLEVLFPHNSASGGIAIFGEALWGIIPQK